MVKIYQDGADFYNEHPTTLESTLVFSAPPGTLKHDFDLEGAAKARALFVTWAKDTGLAFEFDDFD